jgi:hypothetical protein
VQARQFRGCWDAHVRRSVPLGKAGIAYEALDNGIRDCEDPQRFQQILDNLEEGRIEAVVRKWFARMPHLF